MKPVLLVIEVAVLLAFAIYNGAHGMPFWAIASMAAAIVSVWSYNKRYSK